MPVGVSAVRFDSKVETWFFADFLFENCFFYKQTLPLVSCRLCGAEGENPCMCARRNRRKITEFYFESNNCSLSTDSCGETCSCDCGETASFASSDDDAWMEATLKEMNKIPCALDYQLIVL